MDLNKLTVNQLKNIDFENLTLKELKEIFNVNVENKVTNDSTSNMLDRYKGEYVIVRSGNEGINAGYVVDLNKEGIILRDARRIWYHKPKDRKTSWYEGVAQSGLSDDSKISIKREKAIIENYSITVCSEVAKYSIINHRSYEQ